MPVETIICSATDGPANTAGTRASCIPTAERKVLPNNFFYIGRAIRYMFGGRLSCAVTTPGACRWDITMGSAGTTIVFDTLALNMNIVAQTTVPYFLDTTLVCRAVGSGTSTTFFPHESFVQSEALVGSAADTAGSNSSLCIPVGTPAVGAGMDNTAASALDAFYTHTLGTASHTMHTYIVQVLN